MVFVVNPAFPSPVCRTALGCSSVCGDGRAGVVAASLVVGMVPTAACVFNLCFVGVGPSSEH